MPNPTNVDLLNAQLQNQYQQNYFNGKYPCDGITLFELRQKLRNILSNYPENTLISDDPNNDIELNWINDGIGALWPHDWQMVAKSFLLVNNRTAYILPDDCEQVAGVFISTQDINNNQLQFKKIPHYDGWTYDNAFMDATLQSVNTPEGGWVDKVVKAVIFRDAGIVGAYNRADNSNPMNYPWIVVRYVRRWPYLVDDADCINPTPNRVLAIIYHAAAQYFASQFQVSTESIRYQNYIAIGQQFQQMAMQQLVRDSKPLYFS